MFAFILATQLLASGIIVKPTAGGAGNFTSQTVDFGAAGSDKASLVVTGQSWVGATSVVICNVTEFSTADRADGTEDATIEKITVGVSARVVGTGFTIDATPALGFAIGKFLIHCTGG